MTEIYDAGPRRAEAASETAPQCPHCRGFNGIRNILAIQGGNGTHSLICKGCIVAIKAMETPWEDEVSGKKASSLYLKVEALGASDIYDCIKEAKALSQKIGIGVDFDFNGVTVMVREDTDIKQTATRALNAVNAGGKPKFV